MKKQTFIALILLLMLSPKLRAQDSLVFKGQISSWMLYANENDLKSWFGLRYIPQLNYQIALPENQLIDFEASANIA
ncbi:MAG: hypothetical protein JW729_07320, partial [Bacteroidales bacterium]|nr:hypothetical protein [Bacteroidales bacterium]